jgi:hypothetical protein
MKNWILILFLVLPTAFRSNAAQLYAQHGHGGAGLGSVRLGPGNCRPLRSSRKSLCE